MARPRLPWIKLWFDLLNDPKFFGFTLAEFAIWVKLLLLAGQSPERGKLLITDGQPLSIEHLKVATRVRRHDVKAFDNALLKLLTVGCLHWEGNVLVVTHFTERQDKYPSDFQSSALSPNSFPNNSVKTPPEEEGRGRGERKRKKKTTSGSGEEDRLSGVNTKKSLTRIVKVYEENIGKITPLIGEDLKRISSNYSALWFEEAVKEAVENNVKKLNYVKAILNRWETDGFKTPLPDRKPDKKRRSKDTGPTEQDQALIGRQQKRREEFLKAQEAKAEGDRD